MKYIECPDTDIAPKEHLSLFIAGGITGCPDWQRDLVELLYDAPITIYNPRRANFPIDDPSAAEEQIKWEFAHIRYADLISFWFPKETLCPITLYELGACNMFFPKRLAVGIDPGYERELDIRIQTKLVRNDTVPIVNDLESLSHSIIKMIEEKC